jgi:hypothetical protein
MVIKSRCQFAHRQRPTAVRVKKVMREVGSNHFFSLLTSPELLELVEASQPEYRERHYPPTVALSMFLSQVLSADGSCQNSVNEAIVNRLLCGLPALSVNTGGYCRARARLPVSMIRSSAMATAAWMTKLTPQPWLWRGRHVKLADGTTTLMPDTKANQVDYPQHGRQESGVGCSIARLVGVISLAHGAVLDVAMGPYKGKETGEYGLFRRLLECFTQADVMLADSYYCSYFLIAELLARGADLVLQQHGARDTDFRRGERLGRCDHVVRWIKPVARPGWMTLEQYHSYPQELTLREVRVQQKILVTSFLDPQQVCKREIGYLFLNRWHAELDLRNIKTTLGMETLRCKSPAMCEKELWVYMLAYNLIRLLMAQAAVDAQALPRQLSFKHTLQVWVAWSQRQFLIDGKEDSTALFVLIAQVRVGNRPGRIEPRAIKRRPKAFPRLQIPRRKARARIRRYGRIKRRVA